MTTVFEDLDLPGGGVPPSQIRITLWGAGQAVVGRSVGSGHFIGGTKVVTPEASSGFWEQDLVGNDDIIPAGTSYKIEHVFGCDTYVSYISVPVTGGPFSPQMIEVDAMNTIAAPALGVHAGDELLHGGGIEIDFKELTSVAVVTGSATEVRVIPNLIVTVPDSPRPIYLFGRAPIRQQTGGPTTGGGLAIVQYAGNPVIGWFVALDLQAPLNALSTTPQTVDAFARLPPHSAGQYALASGSTTSNFTARIEGSVLNKAWLRAVRA